MDIQEQLDLWNQQASDAVNAGADPSAVEDLLRQKYASIGADLGLPAPKKSKKVGAQSTPWYPQIVKDINAVRTSPNAAYATGEYDPKPAQETEDSPGFFSNLAAGLRNAGSSALRTGLLAEGGIPWLPQAASDALFKAAQQEKADNEALNQAGASGTGAGGVAGSFLGGLGTLGIGALSEGQDVLDEGGSLGQAEAVTGINAAANEAGLLAGKLLPGAGMTRRATRVAAQGAAGGLLGEVGRTAKNEVLSENMQTPFSWQNLAFNAGASALGGLADPGVSAPKTSGDPHFDAGVKAFDALTEKKADTGPRDIRYGNDFIEKYGNTKNFGPAAEFGDVTKKGPANLGSITDADVTQSKPRLSIKTDLPETFTVPQPDNAVSANILEPKAESWPVIKPKQATTLAPEKPTSTSVKKAYRLDEQGNPVEVINPIKPRTKEGQRAAQIAELKAILQDAARDPAKMEGWTHAEPVGEVDLQAQAEANRLTFDTFDKYRKGTLTTGHLLDSIADNHDSMFDDMPQIRTMAGILRDAAKRLGAENVPIRRFDPTTDTNKMVNDHFARSGVRGLYDYNSDAVVMRDQVPNAFTALHETYHALTNEAIYKGSQGKLPLEQQKAYTRLSEIAKQLTEYIDDGRNPHPENPNRYDNGEIRHYGLHNVDEFGAEFWANSKFQQSLRNVSLDDVGLSGMARLAKGAVRNVYEAVTRNFRQLLGMPEKAETGFDAMFTVQKDFLDKLTPADRGNYVGSHAAFDETPTTTLRTKDSKPRALGRMLFGRSIPEIGAARERSKGGKAAAEIEGDQWANSVHAIIKANPDQGPTILRHLNNLTTDRAAPEAKASYQALADMGPDTKKIADRAMQLTKDSIEVGKLHLANADRSDLSLNLASKAIKGASQYAPRVYGINEIKNYGKNLMTNYQAAKAREAAGTPLSKRDTEAIARVDGARKWLLDSVYPEGSDVFNRDVAVNQAIDQLLGLSKEEASGAIRQFKNMRQDAEVYGTRSNVPPALRKLWGEETSPVVRIAEGIRKQGAAKASLQAMEDIKTAGLGKFLVEKEGVPGYTARIEGDTYGALDGLYTTPDVKDMIESFIQGGKFLGNWGQALLGDPTANAALNKIAARSISGLRGVTSGLKSLNIIGNLPAAFLRNAVGSPVQIMTNGNTNVRSMYNGVRAMSELVAATHKTNMGDLAHDATRLGLVEATQLTEAFSPLTKRAMTRFSSSIDPATVDLLSRDGMVQRIKQLGYNAKESLNIVKEIYGAADLWTKLANYDAEVQFRLKNAAKNGALPPAQVESVKQQTANLINDTNVTPSRAWMVAKLSDAVGATQFAPYAAEVVRTTLNNLNYGRADVLQGLKTGDMALAMHGAKRLAGTATAALAVSKGYGALVKVGAGALGLIASKAGEDEETKKYLQTVDQFKGGEPIVLKDDKGNEFVLDAAQFNPMDQASRPTQKLMEAITAGNVNDAKQKLDELADIVVGTVGKSSLWAYGHKIMAGAKPAWAKDNPELYNAALEKARLSGASDSNINRLLGTITAGSPKLLQNLAKAQGQNSETGKSLVASGIGGKEIDPLKDLRNYGAAVARGELGTAKKEYIDMLRQNVNTSIEQARPFYTEGLNDAKKTVGNLKAAIEAAKEQGKSRTDIVKSLISAGVESDLIGELLKEKPDASIVMLGSLDRDLKNDILTARTPEELTDAKRRYSNGMRIMYQLLKENRNGK